MTYATRTTATGRHYASIKDDTGHIIGEALRKTLLGVLTFLKAWGGG